MGEGRIRNAKCPCGSGKKYKWCCGVLLQEAEKLIPTKEQKRYGKYLIKKIEKGNNDN